MVCSAASVSRITTGVTFQTSARMTMFMALHGELSQVRYSWMRPIWYSRLFSAP